MDWKKLALNALLAGFWAGLAAWQASGSELTTAAVFAAGAVVIRVAVGYVAAALNKPVPVDA